MIADLHGAKQSNEVRGDDVGRFSLVGKNIHMWPSWLLLAGSVKANWMHGGRRAEGGGSNVMCSSRRGKFWRWFCFWWRFDALGDSGQTIDGWWMMDDGWWAMDDGWLVFLRYAYIYIYIYSKSISDMPLALALALKTFYVETYHHGFHETTWYERNDNASCIPPPINHLILLLFGICMSQGIHSTKQKYQWLQSKAKITYAKTIERAWNHHHGSWILYCTLSCLSP